MEKYFETQYNKRTCPECSMQQYATIKLSLNDPIRSENVGPFLPRYQRER